MRVVLRDPKGRRLAPDETGSVYGKLTVLRRAEKKLKKNGDADENAIWVCQCECGNTSLVRGQCLRSGNSKSCGCARRESFKPRKRPVGMSAANRAIGTMMRNAANRSIDWCLTMDQAMQLMAANCHYCDAQPSNVCGGKAYNGNFIYSGIDRIDNAGGYVDGNVVSCCAKCNTAKSDMTLQEFSAWLSRAYAHFLGGPQT